jgi:hypothetical protein
MTPRDSRVPLGSPWPKIVGRYKRVFEDPSGRTWALGVSQERMTPRCAFSTDAHSNCARVTYVGVRRGKYVRKHARSFIDLSGKAATI